MGSECPRRGVAGAVAVGCFPLNVERDLLSCLLHPVDRPSHPPALEGVGDAAGLPLPTRGTGRRALTLCRWGLSWCFTSPVRAQPGAFPRDRCRSRLGPDS